MLAVQVPHPPSVLKCSVLILMYNCKHFYSERNSLYSFTSAFLDRLPMMHFVIKAMHTPYLLLSVVKTIRTCSTSHTCECLQRWTDRQTDNCDWVWEKPASIHIYKYIEIQFWNIKYNISWECKELLVCLSPLIYSYTMAFSWPTLQRTASWNVCHFR